MTKHLPVKNVREHPLLVITLLLAVMLAWSLAGSLIHSAQTNRVIANYLVQDKSIMALFFNSTTPYSLKSIPNPVCRPSTSLDFVAHEDDDLLFMNPDLLHDIQAGNCVRTIYFTAGDAGRDSVYWLSRQKGAETAYDSMLNRVGETWDERIIKLPDGQLATLANPSGNDKVTLLFLHMPDGNLRGGGFTRTDHQSLEKLYTDKINSIETVDNTSSYTSTQLTQTLISIMQTFKPNKIRSLSSNSGTANHDHSDHINVARFTTLAYKAYLATKPKIIPTITYYRGYPIRGLPANISSEADINNKTKAFLAYGAFDGASCHKLMFCYTQAIYGLYLRREYTSPY